MARRALITGVAGQDGSYLAELLLEKGYEVHGIVRRSSLFNRGRIEHLLCDNRLTLHYGDMTDSSNLNRIIERVAPDEIYNLAAQSHVHISFEVPEYTAETDAVGTLRLLDALKVTGSNARFYQASTSELFGGVSDAPQNESTPFHPRSPYGVAKLYAHWIVVNYREAYGLHASNGILFNHESPRRGENFITRKVSMTVARQKGGGAEVLTVGNLNATRDWGYAPDYVEAMWLMLQQPRPDDYVVATGRSHSVRELIEIAYRIAGFQVTWKGSGEEEKGYDVGTGRLLVAVDPRFYRPSEVDRLLGDPTKAQRVLDWASSVGFAELVRIMVEADCRSLRAQIADLR